MPIADTITGIIHAATECVPATKTEVVSTPINSPPTASHWSCALQSSRICSQSEKGSGKAIQSSKSSSQSSHVCRTPAKAWFDANPDETSTKILNNAILIFVMPKANNF